MDDFSDNIPKRQGGWWIHFRARLSRFQRVLARHWWIVFLTTAVGLAISAWFIFQQKAMYVSSGRMMVSGRINLPAGAVFSEELANFFGTQVELMRSEEVRNRAAARLAATEPQLQGVPVGLMVAQVPQTSIFMLSTTGPEPKYTQKILDATMAEYIATKRDMRSTKSESTQSAILEEISRIEKDMHSGEQELLDFQKQNNVGYLEQEGNSAGSYLSNLNKQLADLRTQYQLFDTLDVDQIIEKTENDPTHAGDLAARSADTDSQGLFGTGQQPEDQYLQAKQQLAIMQSQQKEMAKVMRPKHPEMINLGKKISEQQALISTLRDQSLERLRSKKDSIKHQIENLENVIKEWDAKALSSSRRLGEYNKIKANVDRSKNLYNRLVGNLHDVDVTRNVDQDMVSILDNASPAQAVKPGWERIVLLGVGAGLLLGIGILVLLDQIDDRVGSVIDLQSAFQEQILGQIPSEKSTGPLQPLRPDDDRHAFGEALRALRSSLLFLPVEGDRPKTLLVTSAVPNEGKSTIALNLAIAMASANVRVLLVDGDLRRGTLNKWFDQDQKPGLTEYLSGTATLEQCVLSTSTANLDMVTRGSAVPNTGELLLGNKLDSFLRNVYNSYQYIIIDSSPIMAADDTTSLAPKIDASLFVLRLGHSSARNSRKAIELLRDRQANVIGIVCNDVSPSSQEYYHYKYPEYYGATAVHD